MRIVKSLLILAALSSAATAQPAPAPTGPTEYTLTISPEEVNWIGRALEELPAKVANPIIQRLIQQVTAQNEAFKKVHPPAPEATPRPPEKPKK